MRSRWKRWSILVLLCVSLLVLVLFFPGLPWTGRIRHTLKRTTVKAEMTLARWRGHEPRFISIAGTLKTPGAQVQALDSRSGWATLADRDGRFVLPDVMWYPGAVYELVISNDESAGMLIKVRAPEAFPESGVFSAGELNLSQGSEVELGSLIGVNSSTLEGFDSENSGYYKELFDKLTAGKQSDEEKIGAINDYVASKLNYDETQWELGSARRVLDRGSQFCGHLSNAMETLLAIGGYRTRAVHMSNGKIPPGTHAVVEVFYGGGWHLYDPTFGIKFTKDGYVASYRDVSLDTSVISEDLFQRFRPKVRREFMALLPGIYETGYHHFYYFKNNK
ncbi:MAG: transglutaminase-like domain-containing protein [Acidobacteriota bacterium]